MHVLEGAQTMRAVDIPQIAGMSAPESHLEELDRRLPSRRSHPGRLLTFQELQARIAGRRIGSTNPDCHEAPSAMGDSPAQSVHL